MARAALGIAEFAPLIAFVYAGRLDADIAQRFYWGAALVLVVVPALALFRYRPNPLLVAVDVWLCVEAFAFLVYIPWLAQTLALMQESAFFVTILLVGIGYTAFSKRKLLTVAHADRRRVTAYSLVLLALAGAGLAASLVFRGDELLAAVVPATGLFIAQLLLGVYLEDRGA